MLENRTQDVPQDGSGLEVDFPVDAEHCYVLVLLVGREDAHRSRIGRRLGDVGLLGG